MTTTDPRDYAEAIAFFNECKARRVRDKDRIAELEAELAALRAMLRSAFENGHDTSWSSSVMEYDEWVVILRERICDEETP